jgi:hypothetical protein
MARIELRDCDIVLQDGLSGTALVNQLATPPDEDDTTLTIDGITLNTADTDKVPVGARFTLAGETTPVVHTVTARTPESTGPTTQITFTPALGAGTYANDDVVTFAGQELEIKVGDGNLTYTEHAEYQYLLDRGDLDSVREGNQVPMDVKVECVYEHITTGTSEQISPLDALKGKGAAAEWVSASADLCEPYCVHVLIRHTPPCGTSEREQTAFPMFRADSREINVKDATIAISGKCKATEPQVNRLAAGAVWPAVT